MFEYQLVKEEHHEYSVHDGQMMILGPNLASDEDAIIFKYNDVPVATEVDFRGDFSVDGGSNSL